MSRVDKNSEPLTPEQRKLLQDNMGLAGQMAKKALAKDPVLCRYGDYHDLVQEGFLILCRCVKHYDPNNEWGANFCTYACRSILFELRKRIANQTIRIPVNELRKDSKRMDCVLRSLASAPVSSLSMEALRQFESSIYEGNEEELTNLREDVRNAVRFLCPLEKRVVCRYYGIGGEGPMTLDEVGSLQGISKERTRQILRTGLEKMRRKLKGGYEE